MHKKMMENNIKKLDIKSQSEIRNRFIPTL